MENKKTNSKIHGVFGGMVGVGVFVLLSGCNVGPSATYNRASIGPLATSMTIARDVVWGKMLNMDVKVFPEITWQNACPAGSLPYNGALTQDPNGCLPFVISVTGQIALPWGGYLPESNLPAALYIWARYMNTGDTNFLVPSAWLDEARLALIAAGIACQPVDTHDENITYANDSDNILQGIVTCVNPAFSQAIVIPPHGKLVVDVGETNGEAKCELVRIN